MVDAGGGRADVLALPQVFEMLRKLLLTSLGTALASNGKPYSQLLIKIAISFVFLLVFVRHSPFAATEVDIICCTTQLCTLLTLMYALCIKIGFFEAEGISAEWMAAGMLVIQTTPLVIALLICGWLVYSLYGDLIEARLHEMESAQRGTRQSLEHGLTQGRKLLSNAKIELQSAAATRKPKPDAEAV